MKTNLQFKCESCNALFIPKDSVRKNRPSPRFCSRKCAATQNPSIYKKGICTRTPAQIEQHRETMRQKWTDPEYKQRVAANIRKTKQAHLKPRKPKLSPEELSMVRSANQKRRWQDPTFRASMQNKCGRKTPMPADQKNAFGQRVKNSWIQKKAKGWIPKIELFHRTCPTCHKEFTTQRSSGRKPSIFCSSGCGIKQHWQDITYRENSIKKHTGKKWSNHQYAAFQKALDNGARDKIRTARLKQKMTTFDTIPQQEMRTMLSALGVSFEEQKIFYIKNGCQPDFFLPDLKTIIQTDGTYSHNYPFGNARDHRQDQELEGLGYRVLRFWHSSKKPTKYDGKILDFTPSDVLARLFPSSTGAV
jgi:very-short-patch-repair endonuclease